MAFLDWMFIRSPLWKNVDDFIFDVLEEMEKEQFVEGVNKMFLNLFILFLVTLILCIVCLFSLLAFCGLKDDGGLDKGKVFFFWFFGAGAEISLICIVAICVLRLFGYVR